MSHRPECTPDSTLTLVYFWQWFAKLNSLCFYHGPVVYRMDTFLSTAYINTMKWMLSMFFNKLGNYLSSWDSVIHLSKNLTLASKAKYLVFWQVTRQFHAFASSAGEFSLCSVVGEVSKLLVLAGHLWLSATYEDVFWLHYFSGLKNGRKKVSHDRWRQLLCWLGFISNWSWSTRMQEGKDNFLKNMSISKHKNDPDTSCLNKDAPLSFDRTRFTA